MTNPFGGVGGSTDVGTASGKVRIEYESVGAPTVVNEVQRVQAAVEKSAASMEALNKHTRETASGLGGFGATGFGTAGGGGVASHVSQMTAAIAEFKRQGSGLTFDSIPMRFDQNFIREQAREAHKIVQQQFDRGEIKMKIHVEDTSGSRGGQGSLITDLLGGRGFSAFRILGVGAGQALGGGIAGGLATAGVFAGITAATAAVGAAVAGVGYTIAKGFGCLENIDSATVKMRALGYSSQQVQSIMQSALASVEKTRYSLDEAATTAVQALAAGIKGGDQLTNYLKDVANTAELAKTSMAEMGYYFNQVATQGHLEGNQLQELQQRGVPILQYLADEYGVTQQKASQMVTAGQVDFAHFEEAIHNHVGGIADTMGGSIQGSFQNLETSIKKLGAAFLQPLFGNANGDMSNFAAGIQKVQHVIDEFAGQLQSHKKGLIDFWADMGQVALLGAKATVDAVDLILHIVGDISKALAAPVSAFGALADAVGAHGVSKELYDAAEGFNSFGDGTNRAGNKIYGFNRQIDSASAAIEGWRDKSKDAAGATNDLSNAFGAIPAKTISIADALEKLNIKSDDASKKMSGNAKQFKELLDQMVKAGASKELLDSVTKLHDEYNSTGRAAEEYGDALDKLSDSSATAEDKAKSLIKALQDLNSLPNQDATKNLDDAIRKATDYQSNLVDHLDLTGGALVNANSTINTTTKNGSTLVGQIDDIRKAMYAMAASGEGNPAEIWERSNQALTVLLQKFGIVGPEAQKIIDTYLKPEKDFEIIFKAKNEPEVQRELTQLVTQLDDVKAKGSNQVDFKINVDQANAGQLQQVLEQLGAKWNSYDPLSKTASITVPPEARDKVTQAIQGIFANDPSKIPSTLDIKTTQSDILKAITSADGALHIPTILDIPAAGQPGGPPAGTPGAPGGPPPPPAPSGPDNQPITAPNPDAATPPPPGTPGVNAPLPPGVPNDRQLPHMPASGPGVVVPQSNSITGQSLLDQISGEALARQRNKSLWEKFNAGFPDESKPDYSQFGQKGATVAPSQASLQNLLGKSNDQISDLITQHPDIAQALQPRIEEAKKQGKNFSQAFSDGIASGNTDVIRAILELAGLAGDGLGRSPAKYGPLSGDGWTFIRGQKFTTAWAEGIASQSKAVAGAGASVANAGIMPLDDAVTGWVKDMTSLAKLAQGWTGLVQQVAGIGLGFAKVANTLSGGRLFPKSYYSDPTIDPRRNPLGTWAPGGAGMPAGAPSSGDASAAGGQNLAGYRAPATGYTQDQAAMAIIAQAQARGLNQEQTLAALTTGIWETGLGSNPMTNTRQNQNGTPGIAGLFQQDNSYDQYGNKLDPNVAAQGFIDQYIKLGGLNKDPYKAAIDVQRGVYGADALRSKRGQALDLYNRLAGTIPKGPSVGGPNPGAGLPVLGGRTPKLRDTGSVGSEPLVVQGANIVASLFPQLREIGGSRPAGTAAPGTHDIGRTIDIMMPGGSSPDSTTASDKALGDQIYAYLREHGAQLGITSMIWQGVGTNLSSGRSGPAGSTWQQGGHHDHIDVQFMPPGSVPLLSGATAGAGVPQAPSPPAPAPVAPRPAQPPAAPQAPSAPAPSAPTPPAGPAHWMPVTGKDGQQWYYAKTSAGDRWVPPGIDPATIDFTADGLPKAPNGQIWSNSGILVPSSGKGSFTAPDTPKDFKPQALPAAPGSPAAAGLGQPPAAPGSQVPGQPGQPTTPTPTQPDGSPNAPLNVVGPDGSPWAGQPMPGQPVGGMADLIAQHPELGAVIGGVGNRDQAITALQSIDGLLTDQNKIIDAADKRAQSGLGPQGYDPKVAQAKELSDALGTMKSNLTQQFGLKEGDDQLSKMEDTLGKAGGIAGDIFETVDAYLKAVAATQNGLDILVRGVSNTQDVNKLIDDMQTWITVAAKGIKAAGDITSMAGSFSGGMDMGGVAAAGQAMSLISQALEAINTGIDLAQETYQETMKYVGRFMTSFLGFPGAQDMNFLLDTETGQLQAYTSANPDMKTTFNTLGRNSQPGNYVDQRVQPTNNFVISMAPGADPMDMMNDTMFAVRSSGIGALGYDTARPA